MTELILGKVELQPKAKRVFRANEDPEIVRLKSENRSLRAEIAKLRKKIEFLESDQGEAGA